MYEYYKDKNDIVYQVKVNEELYIYLSKETCIELQLGNWCLLLSSRLGNESYANTMIQMSATWFSLVEQFGILCRRLQGNNASFIDVIDLENPDMKVVNEASVFIPNEKEETIEEIPDDFCGALMHMIALCKKRISYYENAYQMINDEACKILLFHMIESIQQACDSFHVMLSEIGVEDGQRLFMDNYEEKRSFDYDSENYFDPKNPKFYQP